MKVKDLIDVTYRIPMNFYFYDNKRDIICEIIYTGVYGSCSNVVLDKEITDIELDKENGKLDVSLKGTVKEAERKGLISQQSDNAFNRIILCRKNEFCIFHDAIINDCGLKKPNKFKCWFGTNKIVVKIRDCYFWFRRKLYRLMHKKYYK